MPHDWTTEELIAEPVACDVLERAEGAPDRFRFTRTHHRDAFAARALRNLAVEPGLLHDLLGGEDVERWVDALAVLLDIAPEAASVWDALSAPMPPTATQVWLAHRPPDATAPAAQATEFERCLKAHVTRQPRALPSDAARRLADPDASRRLGAMTKWVVPDDLAAVLAAANDDHALIRGVARYALAHAGAASADHPADAPPPPLVGYRANSGRCVRSRSRCHPLVGHESTFASSTRSYWTDLLR
jgi:hypothetical protein